MSNVHEDWLEGVMNDSQRERIEEIDRKLATLKVRYKTVRQSYSKDSARAQAILSEVVKLRSEKARVFHVANMIKEALGG